MSILRNPNWSTRTVVVIETIRSVIFAATAFFIVREVALVTDETQVNKRKLYEQYRDAVLRNKDEISTIRLAVRAGEEDKEYLSEKIASVVAFSEANAVVGMMNLNFDPYAVSYASEHLRILAAFGNQEFTSDEDVPYHALAMSECKAFTALLSDLQKRDVKKTVSQACRKN